LKSSEFEKIFSWTLAAVLVLSPMAFGSVHPWSYGIESAAVFVLFALWLWTARKNGGITVTASVLTWLLPLSLLFFVLQAVPLPSSLVRSLSPGRAAVDCAAGVLGVSSGSESLAVYPWGLEQQAFFLTASLLIFLMVINLVRKKEQVEKAMNVLFFTGAALSAFALMQRVSISTRSFLPFINKNHFAGYMELLVPLAVSALLYHIERLKKKETLRETLISAISSPSGTKIIFFLFLAVLFSVCVILTYSRGGIGGMMFSLAVLAATLGRKKKTALLAAACGAVIVFFIFSADEGKVAGHVVNLVDGTDMSALLRAEVWNDTASIIKAFPGMGVGLGGFETAFTYFKSNDIQMNFFQPENDYLYILAEGGLVGFYIAAAFILFYFIETWGKFRKRTDRFSRSVYAGSVAGLSGLLLHGLVDTSLHMPAILFACSALLGLGYVAVSVRFKYPADPEGEKYLRERHFSLASFPARAAVTACIVLAVSASAVSLASAGADLIYRSGLNTKAKLDFDDAATYEDYRDLDGWFEAASRLDPLCAQYKFEQGRAEEWLAEYYSAKESLGGRKDGMSREYYSMALGSFRDSLDLNPYSSFGHLVAGRILKRGFGRELDEQREYQAALRLNPTSRLIQEQFKRIAKRYAAPSTGTAGKAHDYY
jgi:O-antigen ligase